MPITPDEAATLVYRERWEVVTDEIRRRILGGVILPGSRIRETELAEDFGVSRGPVREALRTLEGAGLVVRLPRRGSYVAPVRPRDVDEIYTLRAAVEVLAVKRALTESSRSLLSELDSATEGFHSSLARGDLTQVVEADIEFHSVFYRHADHKRLVGVWGSLSDPLRIMMGLSSRRSDPEWEGSVGGHLRIATAAREQNVSDCVDATLDHLERARDLVMSFVEQQEVQASDLE